MAPMPKALYFIALGMDDYRFIYVFGGFQTGGGGNNNILKYDAINNDWETLASTCANKVTTSAKGKFNIWWLHSSTDKKIFSFDMETDSCNMVLSDNLLAGKIILQLDKDGLLPFFQF